MDAAVDALEILNSPAAIVKMGKIHRGALSEKHISGLGKAKANPRWERLSADVHPLTKLKYTRAETSSEI